MKVIFVICNLLKEAEAESIASGFDKQIRLFLTFSSIKQSKTLLNFINLLFLETFSNITTRVAYIHPRLQNKWEHLNRINLYHF